MLSDFLFEILQFSILSRDLLFLNINTILNNLTNSVKILNFLIQVGRFIFAWYK